MEQDGLWLKRMKGAVVGEDLLFPCAEGGLPGFQEESAGRGTDFEKGGIDVGGGAAQDGQAAGLGEAGTGLGLEFLPVSREAHALHAIQAA